MFWRPLLFPRRKPRNWPECLGLATDEYGFLEHETFNPVKAGDRVFFAGACGFAVETQGAQYQGAAAAAEVIALFNRVEQGGRLNVG